MDLEELRLNCLRMAFELGGKSEAVISAANDLLSFVTKGPTADTLASALEPATTVGEPCEISAPADEPAVADRIAACGTALEMPVTTNTIATTRTVGLRPKGSASGQARIARPPQR